MKPIARLLSIVLHPLFMPAYTLGLALRVDPQVSFFLRAGMFWTTLIMVGTMTIIFPLTSTLLLMRAGLVRSIELPTRQERVPVFVSTMLYYAMTWWLLQRSPLHGLLPVLFGGAFLALILTALITLRWKISVHMVGIGGLLGALCAIALLHRTPLLPLIATVLVLAGALGTARLLTSDHSPAQVYAGTVLGFACVFGCAVLPDA
jgi:hypothetical protein